MGQLDWRLIMLVGLLLSIFVTSGCASEQQAEPECQSTEDCAQGEVCDTVLGVCEPRRTNMANNSMQGPMNNGPGGDIGTVDAGEDDDVGVQEDVDGANGDDVDTGSDSDPEPDPDPEDTGTDTSPVIPTEDAGDEDADNGDTGTVDEPCTQEFGDCDPTESQPEGFVCLETDEEAGTGNCFMTCEVGGSASNCATERYCLTYEGQPICSPSECDTHSDCSGGTCIGLDNSYGFCREDGSGSDGSICSGGQSGQCQTGMVCDASEGQTGECRDVCNPFESAPCGTFSLDVCTVRWNRTGVCTSDYTSYGIGRFSDCDPPGAWCDDAIICVSGATDNICLEYCRPGMFDCGMDVCDESFILGNDALGVCMPPCTSSSDCGDEMDCVNERCRLPCITDADCCDDDASDCAARCEGGYCI